MVQIVVVNASKVLSDRMVARYVPIMAAFDKEAVAPAWNLEPCEYMFDTWTSFSKQRPNGPTSRDDVWPIFINNRSDMPGALGWHDGVWEGRPIVFGRVFAGDCKRYGTDWRTDLTHEAWEMRGDPGIDRTMALADGRQAAVELCDPVEDDLYAIPYKKSKVSNFVLPSYFGIGGVAPPYDYGHVLKLPCPHLMSGGYQSLLVNGQWTSVVARLDDGKLPYKATRAGRGFRRAGGTT